MSRARDFELRTVNAMADVDATAWDALKHHDNPFVAHAFLALLESSGSVGKKSGWQPRHVVAYQRGVLVGAMPLYLRTNSYGEYIFDWAWAQAGERAGIAYYPKLTSAVPFTPATGPRLLVKDGVDVDAVRLALLSGALQCARDEDCSSLHVLFARDDEADLLAAQNLARRASAQFHWRNDSYANFEEFLEKLRHEDRKQIRRERRRVLEAGLDVSMYHGASLAEVPWDEIFAMYTSTSDRKWGSPYLTRAFFAGVPRVLSSAAVVALAKRDDVPVAMTLSFERGAHLYGRYWGCRDDVPGLHFELCYYQLIERAIARGMILVEAGAQGEHKLKRGFLPVLTHSCHAIFHPELSRAITRFVDSERKHVAADLEELLSHAPFKQGAAPGHPLVAGVGPL